MNEVYREINSAFENAAPVMQADAPPKRLNTVNSEELCEMRLERRRYTVDTLLYPGLAVLAGSPKIGKSWMVMHLCLQIAKGGCVWGMPCTQGSVLYIALEDSSARLQERVLAVTDKSSPHLYFSLDCARLGDDLEEEIRTFKTDHPDAVLVAIDTFQKIRAQGVEMSYANDYSEVSRLKRLADELGIVILLVHHTRKQADNDRMNEISGTNGIAGSADTLMVLKKEKRLMGTATLYCTGRDVTDRELTLKFNSSTCQWELQKDSLERQEEKMPHELELLVSYMMNVGYFFGTMSAFTEHYCQITGAQIAPNQLKRMMNRYRYPLEDQGVSFASIRRPTGRMISVTYQAPDTDKQTEQAQEKAAPADTVDDGEPASAPPDDGDLF